MNNNERINANLDTICDNCRKENCLKNHCDTLSEEKENHSPSTKDNIKEAGENRCNDLISGDNVKDSVTRGLQVSNQCSSEEEHPNREVGGSKPSTEDTLSELNEGNKNE